MDWWIVLLLLTGIVATVVTLLLLPVTLSLSLQARGEPDGMYAAAGGAKFGPLTGTFVLSRQVPLEVEMRLFGKALRRSARTGSESTKASNWAKSKFDPLDVLTFLLEERRRIAFEQLSIELSYSFRDVALTGKILASLAVLSALLPARISLRQTPSWDLESRAELALDGRLRVWPGRLLLDGLRFGTRALMLKRRESAARSDTFRGSDGP